MNKHLSRCLSVVVVALLTSAAAHAQTSLLQPGDRVAIAGDSITEQKQYSVFMETYFLACKPQPDLQAIQPSPSRSAARQSSGAGWMCSQPCHTARSSRSSSARSRTCASTSCPGRRALDWPHRQPSERTGSVQHPLLPARRGTESNRRID